jgi:hypothetical protein
VLEALRASTTSSTQRRRKTAPIAIQSSFRLSAIELSSGVASA